MGVCNREGALHPLQSTQRRLAQAIEAQARKSRKSRKSRNIRTIHTIETEHRQVRHENRASLAVINTGACEQEKAESAEL